MSNPDIPRTVSELRNQVPEAHLNYLRKTGDDASRYAWDWGHIANMWIAQGAPSMLSYALVAEEVGHGRTSIRTYAYLEKTYSPTVREEYGLLSIGHFLLDMIARNSGYPSCFILAYAVGVADERGGRPASVDECRAAFKIKGRVRLPTEPTVVFSHNGHPAWSWPILRRLLNITDPQERYRLELGLDRLIRRIGV